MKVEFIIKTAEKRGYKVTRSEKTGNIIVKKENWFYRIFPSYNKFYKEILEGR